MSKNIFSPLVGLASVILLAAGAAPARATIVAVDDAVSSPLNAGGTELNPAEYIIGSTGANPRSIYTLITGTTTSYNHLTIQNGSVVSGGVGYVGAGSSSNYNQVTITGTGSAWNIDVSLLIGNNGSNNRIVVENGGLLQNDLTGSTVGGVLGYNSTASGNSALITGTGSAWRSGTGSIRVGNEGANNSLRVENGAEVQAQSFSVGWGNSNSAIGGSNSVVVTGSTSKLTYGNLSIAGFSSNNTMRIEDGATLTGTGTSFASVGGGNTNVRSNNNTLIVTGSGSSWTLSNQIRIGSSGTNNRLVIEDGALVVNSNDYRMISLGTGTNATYNSLEVKGAGTMLSGTASFAVAGSYNSATFSNGATVETGNALIGSDFNMHKNSVTVTGEGTNWTVSGTLAVGAYSGVTGNSLLVSDKATINVNGEFVVGTFNTREGSAVIEGGAVVTSLGGGVGAVSSGTANAMVVQGFGSEWVIEGNLGIGTTNASTNGNNTLTIRDEALVRLDGNLLIQSAVDKENFLRLDGGYLAWEGDHGGDVTSLLEDGRIQIWDGIAWVNADGQGEFAFHYFATDEQAFAYTGYEGLGGYTVLTTVPEPGTWALLGLSAAAAYPYLRRRNSRAA